MEGAWVSEKGVTSTLSHNSSPLQAYKTHHNHVTCFSEIVHLMSRGHKNIHYTIIYVYFTCIIKIRGFPMRVGHFMSVKISVIRHKRTIPFVPYIMSAST